MKNLKKSILILSSLIIMVLCSACSKANNYSMSDFVGVYYGENGFLEGISVFCKIIFDSIGMHYSAKVYLE